MDPIIEINEPITKQQLLDDFNNFVIHKTKIIQNSNNPHYKSLKVLSALDKCRQHTKVFQDYKLRGVAAGILHLKRDLIAIMPVLKNPSFEGSQYQLAKLLNNCEKVLNQLSKGL